jgi:hypothetical protein
MRLSKMEPADRGSKRDGGTQGHLQASIDIIQIIEERLFSNSDRAAHHRSRLSGRPELASAVCQPVERPCHAAV